MGFYIRKYLSVFILVFLIGSITEVKAQPHDSVNIRCVSVIDAAGDVTLTWTIPSLASRTTDGWINYFVYASPSGLPATYTLVPTPTIAPTWTSITIPVINLPASPNSRPIYFYIATINSHTTQYNSDTVSSIYLTLTNNTGTAQLIWNPISTPLPQGSDRKYQILRNYNNFWTVIDSTQNPFYTDTITYCDSTILSYAIQIADSTICTSTSNIATSPAKFTCTIGPPQVVMDTTSVTSQDSVDITWHKSPKPNVIGYIIYKELPNGSYLPIDTVYGISKDSLMNYIAAGNPADSSLSFAVAALDSCGHDGPISNPQHTLLLKVKPNVCEQNNTLSWNTYTDIDGSIGGYGIGGYKIFYSVNNGPFQFLATTDRNTTKYIDSNLYTREYRCYYIQVYDSEYTKITASSNIECDSVHPPAKPKNNYLRVATVPLNTSSIQIIGYVDSLSGAEYYDFQRSTDSAGGFSTIYRMNANRHSDSISYIDNSVNPTLHSYHYQIITMDSCDKPIDSTNFGQTILATAVGEPNGTNVLTWNDYRNWYDDPAYYLIYRSEDSINYTLLGTPINYTNAIKNTYTDNISDITNGEGTFYYYIKAVENNAPAMYTFTDTSYSNIAKAYQDPVVFIPDAFNPNGVNKVFIPVGVFINVRSYDLCIFNRWGQLIFESSEPTVGWNGKVGGKVAQEGVYIYLLTYTSSKGEYFQRKGPVTLLK